MKKSLKATLMTILLFVASTAVGLYESSQGLYENPALMWQVIGLTTGGALIVYLVQSYFIVTTSPEGEFNWRDFLKGAIISIGNVLASLIAANVTDTGINWGGIMAATGTVFIGYFIKQIKAVPVGIPPVK
jgi:hypothetical protein